MSDIPDAPGPAGRYCVVGLGNHARTKLIPAILATGGQVAGLVTRSTDEVVPGAERFTELKSALLNLPGDTMFVLANPPALHGRQALEIMAAGHDVIVEKPAFVNETEAREATEVAQARDLVLVEAFMHRHTRLFSRFLTVWQDRRSEIVGLRIRFLVPEMPGGTFRQGGEISASGLYDIGCYALSLIDDLGLSLGAIGVSDVAFAGDPAREAVRLQGVNRGVEIDALVGVGAEYANEVSLQLTGGGEISFAPFFYGRSGEKRVTDGREGVSIISDPDAFRQMFSAPRSEWRASQAERSRSMVALATSLERLGRQLDEWRTGASLT